MSAPYPLEPDATEMRRLVDEAMTRIVHHIETLPDQPAQNVERATDFARTLIEPLPRKGEKYEVLLDQLFDELIPRSFNAAGPGYLAYIPGGGIFHSAVADLISDAVNRYVGVCAAAPALAQIEANVVRWFCEIVGYRGAAQPPGVGCQVSGDGIAGSPATRHPPPATRAGGGGGVLTPGGSLANFIAIATARKNVLGDDFQRATLYCSDQIHHSFQKAASLAGFPAANIREIGVDAKFRIRTDALEEAIGRDRRAGFAPFLIAGSAGTTATGAVDDLARLAAIARENKMWFHVDGAYGALFALTARGAATLRGMEQADSIILDPHKTLFLPFGTGAVLVRDAMTLRRAHSSHADYLPAMQSDEELVDFCEISPELSRDFRGLRVWLPLKMFGVEPFSQQLDEKLDLIAFATAELRKIEGIEIVAEPQLTITAFRLVVTGVSDAQLDGMNRDLIERINARQRVMLTPTILDGRFVIRICIVSHRTHLDRVQMAIDDIRAAVAEVRRDVRNSGGVRNSDGVRNSP
jgi:aromatic-L-amino-acid decarboxylase